MSRLPLPDCGGLLLLVEMPKYEAVISLQLFLLVLENQTTVCYIYDEDVMRIQ